MADDKVLKELVAEFDVVKTWFSPGSAMHRKLIQLTDRLAEAAGGRLEAAPNDPNLATPGPGVRSQTPEPVVVDSVGEMADAPPTEIKRPEKPGTPAS